MRPEDHITDQSLLKTLMERVLQSSDHSATLLWSNPDRTTRAGYCGGDVCSAGLISLILWVASRLPPHNSPGFSFHPLPYQPILRIRKLWLKQAGGDCLELTWAGRGSKTIPKSRDVTLFCSRICPKVKKSKQDPKICVLDGSTQCSFSG